MVPSELESNGALNAIEIVKRKDCEQKGAVPSELGINFGAENAIKTVNRKGRCQVS